MYCFCSRPGILVAARALRGASEAIVHVAGLALISETMGALSTGGVVEWQAIGMFVGAALRRL